MVRIILLLTIFFGPCTFGQIQLLNDEFNQDSTLSQWQNITEVEGWDVEHLEVFDINTSSPDQLHMMPYTTSWFQDYRGPILFKEISGNFIFTTQVSSSNRTSTGIPQSSYSLAGPMIRTPRNVSDGLNDWTWGGENYIFLSIGFAAGSNAPHFEVKNTSNSVSNLEIIPVDTHEDVQIRIARFDSYIICLYKTPGGNWTIRRRYNRTDFPDTMQIGLVTYTDWNKHSSFSETYANSHVINATANPDSSSNPGLSYQPDLVGRFEFARFDSVYLPPPLAGMDLTNPGMVSDDDLLNFLGQPTQPYIPGNIQYQTDSMAVIILPDQINSFINIYGDLSNYHISIVDTAGNVLTEYYNQYHKLTIDIHEIPPGPHFIILENSVNGTIRVQRIIPE